MDYLIRGSDYLAKFEGFELVGRDAELQRMISILMRGRSNSVILVGAGGVGCTALCVGVQAAKLKPDAPFDLVNKRLFWLDTNGLFASGDSQEVNKSFQKIIRRLCQTTEPVLLIDDTLDFIEGCRNSGSLHFINALLSAVRGKKCQIIFEVEDTELDTVIKTHSDIRELFTILPIDEPTGDALLKIAQASAASLTRHHDIRVSPEAVTTAIELTNKYRARDSGMSRAQPERSVTLLDRSLASYRLAVHANPPGYGKDQWDALSRRLGALYREGRDGEIAIADAESQLDAIAAKEAAHTDGRIQNIGFQSPEVGSIKTKVLAIRAAVDLNKAEFTKLTAEINSKLQLTRDLVLAEFSDISGIPASKLNQDEIEKLKALEAALRRRIFGQDEVVRRLSDGIKIGRVGRRNNNKPLAAYLFLGPSGVGKTEISKVLAGVLLDDEAALTRFDMSEYMEKHAVAKLIGAPPGYEGFDAGGILTNLMRKNSYRVLLFDEIEKAHPDIFNIMLQVLEDGRLTDNVGRTVSFSDSIIIMTTNIGQTHFLNDATDEEANAAAMIELSETYRSEFLNRFAGRQNILCFKKLGLESIEKIVRREISGLDAAYSERGIRVEIEDGALEEFCRDQYDPKIGARGLPGFISANLEPIIVNAILNGHSAVPSTALVRYDPKVRRFDVEFTARV